MSVNEDYSHALSYARQAMALMEKNRTPATPQNYELWYNYSLGQDKGLINAVNEAVSKSEFLDPEAAARIYNTHISDALIGDKVDELSSQMGIEAEQLTAMIKASMGATSSYGDSMESISGRLDSVKSPKQLKAIMGTILTATKDMESNTRELEEKLEESKQKIEELNSDLDLVRMESRTDALTNIANRKSFDEQMILLTDQAKETGAELCLVMGDIDHFKKFNDTYGHQTGDQVLRLVAHSIKSNVKGRDVAARYGGEEFAIILPKTSLHNAIKVGNSIREVIQAKELVKRSTGESLGTVTMSFGVSRYIPGEAPEALIKRADACLYAAKHAGRNRVMAETDPGVDMSMVA